MRETFYFLHGHHYIKPAPSAQELLDKFPKKVSKHQGGKRKKN